MSGSRVAIVTGASRGIGRAVAERLAQEGIACAGVARDPEGLEKVDLALRQACDVTDPEAVCALVDRVAAELGRIDIVVNCAGIAGSNSLAGPPGGDADGLWHRIVDTNLNGPYYVCRAALPHLPDGSGRIINLGSVLSLEGVADQTAYTAAKHGVLGLTRALARYLAPRRITVNLLAPGWTETDMARARWRELGTTRAEIEAQVPLGRIVQPPDVAEWAAFLTRPEAAAVTGQVITIDGGAHQH